MINLIKKILLYIGFIYVLLVTFMFFTRYSIYYHPRDITQEEFRDFALNNDLEIVRYSGYDGEQLSALYYAPGYNKPILLYFNGEYGTIEEAYAKLRPFISEGYGFMINIYRDYEVNPGLASQEALYGDSLAIYDHLLGMGHRDRDIVIYGYSIGSGCAVYLAAQKPMSKGLVIESGFTSAEDVMQRMYPHLPMKLIIKDEYSSQKYIKEIEQPKLYLHGDSDKYTPISLDEELYNESQLPKKFVKFKGGAHNNLQDFGAGEEITKFIKNNPHR
jgi:uncharacterized protein